MHDARKYLIDQLAYAFEWQDDGRELCWCDGTVIAFTEEIATVLKRFAGSPLPDFSAIVMVMAAMRGSWPETSERLNAAALWLQDSSNWFVREKARTYDNVLGEWPRVREQLTSLSKFTTTRAPSLIQRAELVAITLRFEIRSTRKQALDAAQLAELVLSGLPSDWLAGHQREPAVSASLLPDGSVPSQGVALLPQLPILRIIETLELASRVADGVTWSDLNEIEQLLQTGVPGEIKVPKAIELDQRDQTRAMIESLHTENDLAGLGRLTKQLMAAVTLPRAISEPDEMPMGGVSDISNRGDLDRLLISELAHDDETLAVRLALNEALYLRREVPPANHQGTRRVFVDLSLPMWGLPRLFATAAALAIQATTERGIRIQCERSDHSVLVKSDLATVAGLREHLVALEATEHPGMALKQFFEEHQADPEAADPVVITTSDVLAGQSFRMALDRCEVESCWLVVVERDGQLQLLHRTRQGLAVRQQIKLALADILEPKSLPLVHNPAASTDAPAIFSLPRLPLLMPHELQPGLAWLWDDIVVSLASDGRLMHWKRSDQAATELLSGLPRPKAAKVFLASRTPECLKLLICRTGDVPSLLVSIYRGSGNAFIHNVKLNEPNVADVVNTREALLVFVRPGKDKISWCVAINANSGEVLGRTPFVVTGDSRVGRCFQRADMSWNILVWQGGSSQWVMQRLPERLQQAISVCEVDHGKYFGITSKGEVFDPEHAQFGAIVKQREAETRKRYVKFLAVAPSETELRILTAEQLAKGTMATEISSDGYTKEVSRTQNKSAVFYQTLRHALHYRFTHVGRSETGLQLVVAASKSVTNIEPNTSTGKLEMSRSRRPGQTHALKPFRNTRTMRHPGFTVMLAEWPGGHKAWLDHRGLLHLQVAGGKVPEVTLVLRDGEMSGWISTGAVFGQEYHIGLDPSERGLTKLSHQDVWQKAVLPFIEAL